MDLWQQTKIANSWCNTTSAISWLAHFQRRPTDQPDRDRRAQFAAYQRRQQCAATHPASREVTIISGVFATSYGAKFDSEELKVLPAGGFYTESAKVQHYIEIREETVP